MLSYLIVFLVMVVLLSLFALGAKRFARGRLTLGGNGSTSRSRQPRLGIVDIYELDRQRQLILLRRDNTEHLLLVGGPNDVVVERNIVRAGGNRVSAELADRSETDAPEAPLSLPAGTEPAPLPPPFPEPETPVRAPEPVRTAPVFAAPPEPAPEPVRPAARFNASRRVEPPSLRAARQTPPPLELPPEPPAEVVPFAVPLPPVMAAPPPMPEPVLPPEPAPAPAGTRGAEPRTVDAAILNDMARQLEEALRRPSSAVAPARPAVPVMSASPEPEPVQAAPEPEPAPPPPEPEPEPAPPPEPPPVPEPEPAPPPEPVPEPPPPPPPPPPEEPAPASKPASVQNPFSVEEIEAEFARLLGRPLDKR